MKNIFEKYETLFCLLLIIVYIIVNLFCQQSYGIGDYRSVIINTIFSTFLVILIKTLKRTAYYGFRKVKNAKDYLYFIPLLLIISVNLWNGININNSISEMAFYILNMINIGFIEEVIFRGFLFKMMSKDNVRNAIIVSSITFGIGHNVNLLNGAEVSSTLVQICYAISIGYVFVVIFHKSKSLIPCIITHALVNSLSIFNNTNNTSSISSIFLIVVPLLYAMYINKKIKE